MWALLCSALWAVAAEAARTSSKLTPSLAPTKGHMQGIVGDTWTLHVGAEAEGLPFLPSSARLGSARKADLKAETLASFQHMKDWGVHRTATLAGGYYNSGKGLQKVGYLCLLLEELYGLDNNNTQECVAWLHSSFECYYNPTALSSACRGAPSSYYDEDWGGLASQEGWDAGECNSDFGNTCYNDHHYHFGYFVVSAAILAKLEPAILTDHRFVGYVNTLVRDTANPSAEDGYFPHFRNFDWFDLHSWSHGIAPMHDGKDQESTSEELNLLYGLSLWGRVTGNVALEKLGSTMLALAAHTAQEFFLLKDGNPYHPADFVRNHVTGVFLQGKVDYTTWFGSRSWHMHGIQMLPLSPALLLARSPEFCRQEWTDILGKEDLQHIPKPWASVILTGGLAMIEPDKAYDLLKSFEEGAFDNGLTRAWALYWAASRAGDAPAALAGRRNPSGSGKSLLMPVGGAARPNATVFPPADVHPVHRPSQTEVVGAKATNKFWSNWVVDQGHHHPIFAMPYVLRWTDQRLEVSHNKQPHYIRSEELGPDRIKAYISGCEPEFLVGAKEAASRHVIISEGLFGFHAELRGLRGESIRFPIYSGMAYVSGRFSGGFTPVVSHPHGLAKLEKARDGVWSFHNRRGAQFRVYVLDADGAFVDSSFNFDDAGQLNKPLDGWVRLAHVLEPSDVEVLDAHASAIVVGCELEVEEEGVVRYKFQKDGSHDVELLHWGFGHHVQLLVPEPEPVSPQSESRRGPLLL